MRRERRSLLVGGCLALTSGTAYTALAAYFILGALLEPNGSSGAHDTDAATSLVVLLGAFVLANSVPAMRFGYSILRHQAASARRSTEMLFAGWSIVLMVWAINAVDHPNGPWLFVPLAIDVAVVVTLRRGRDATTARSNEMRNGDRDLHIEPGWRWR